MDGVGWTVFVIFLLLLGGCLWFFIQNQNLKEKVYRLTRIDKTTGLLNDRGSLDWLSYSVDTSKRYKIPLTMALIEIYQDETITKNSGDFDNIIKAVVEGVVPLLRSTDLLGRLSNNTLLLTLTHTTTHDARVVLERIQQASTEAIATNKVSTNINGPSQFAIGAAGLVGTIDSVEQLLTLCKQGVSKAKTSTDNNLEFISLEPSVEESKT